MSTKHETVTGTRESVGDGLGGGFQVILHNDNHNVFAYVVFCLMKTFDHNKSMAEKIATEAHTKGKAIAQVEDEEGAMRHCLALRLNGLGADVEHI